MPNFERPQTALTAPQRDANEIDARLIEQLAASLNHLLTEFARQRTTPVLQ